MTKADAACATKKDEIRSRLERLEVKLSFAVSPQPRPRP
jgi:hypothetical protein